MTAQKPGPVPNDGAGWSGVTEGDKAKAGGKLAAGASAKDRAANGAKVANIAAGNHSNQASGNAGKR